MINGIKWETNRRIVSTFYTIHQMCMKNMYVSTIYTINRVKAGAVVLKIIFTIGGHQQSCLTEDRTCSLTGGSIFQFGRGLSTRSTATRTRARRAPPARRTRFPRRSTRSRRASPARSTCSHRLVVAGAGFLALIGCCVVSRRAGAGVAHAGARRCWRFALLLHVRRVVGSKLTSYDSW